MVVTLATALVVFRLFISAKNKDHSAFRWLLTSPLRLSLSAFSLAGVASVYLILRGETRPLFIGTVAAAAVLGGWLTLPPVIRTFRSARGRRPAGERPLRAIPHDDANAYAAEPGAEPSGAVPIHVVPSGPQPSGALPLSRRVPAGRPSRLRPVAWSNPPWLVDVFGGQRTDDHDDGRAGLLAVHILSLLAGGHRVWMADLSEDDLSGMAAVYAAAAGVPVTHHDVLGSVGASPLIADLPNHVYPQIIAKAVGALRRHDDGRVEHLAEMLQDVADRLSPHRTITFGLLVDALFVLSGRSDSRRGLLSADEEHALTWAMDVLVPAGSSRVDDLQLLCGALGPLARADDREHTVSAEPARPISWRPTEGLHVLEVATADEGDPAKDLVDQLVIQRAIWEVGRRWRAALAPDHRPVHGPADVMVLSLGQARVDPAHIKRLRAACQRAGIGLLTFFDDFDDTAKEIYNTRSGLSLFMRLGSGAHAAAEAIGHEHTYQRADIGKELSLTATETDTVGESTQGGTSKTVGSNKSHTWGHDSPINPIPDSVAVARARERATTTTRMTGIERSASQALAWVHGSHEGWHRVYDHRVEAVTLQQLYPHEALAVHSHGIEAMDCNPALALLPFVVEPARRVGDPAPAVGGRRPSSELRTPPPRPRRPAIPGFGQARETLPGPDTDGAGLLDWPQPPVASRRPRPWLRRPSAPSFRGPDGPH
ncbi:hypothetical protein FF86_11024 [Frankia sp. CpI1-P]|uniref:hypothetical protein n=1 Tax=unclassified Frankia TaxID=2632575 RepID=UPI0006F4B030|nr:MULTISPECIES: hypothetical protein [unclassified Frankia]KQM01836.1 hypothetical protein FF86_11024 [Frankia sp. CpI1-P]